MLFDHKKDNIERTQNCTSIYKKINNYKNK